eukprot:CAMPEP_0183333098 /NCGR_PEP_ID=MMETSP0164_2-20130417/2077_1 /TAXON_ID=221442 /ORGANISM="Coccolithus pelagicus ssp braarudi, Strain PLY182g" /LENGTH=210 /DNA_ID=CAMNT_0025501935 /DNA_START=12 /DNA_END=644 /DNA_ORIENTATION=+
MATSGTTSSSDVARVVQPPAADNKLRQRYEQLRELRESGPEHEAKRARTALLEATCAASEHVELLKAEVETHKRAALDLSQSVEIAEALQAENAQLRSQLDALRAGASAARDGSRQLALYEALTGIKLDVSEGSVVRCTCTGTPVEGGDLRKWIFSVDESADGADGEWGYIPAVEGGAGLDLPDYLQEEITFEKTAAPALINKIMAAVCR